MNTKLEQTLTKNKIMVFFGILASVLYLAADVPYIFLQDYEYYRFDFLIQLVDVAAIIALIVSYKKGETNLQKALISGLLFSSFVGTFCNTVYYIECYVVDGEDLYDMVLFIAFALFEGAILVSHFVLQVEHKGTLKPIIVITVAVFAAIACDIVDSIMYITGDYDYTWLYLLNNFGVDCYLVMILCIETKIQLYKRIRTEAKANGTWTLEAKEEAKGIFKI